jgi:hypothetical protein
MGTGSVLCEVGVETEAILDDLNITEQTVFCVRCELRRTKKRLTI